MTSASTRHAERSRRAGAFVHQTMRDRGMTCMRNDLDAALLELTPMQLEQVHASAAALAKGADSREHMTLLAALRTTSAHATRTALAAAGAIYRADVLLPLATNSATAPTFMRELARLRRPDLPASEREQAANELRAMSGQLDHSDLVGGSPAEGQVAPHDANTSAQAAIPDVEPFPMDRHGREREHPSECRPAPASSGPPRQSLKVYGKMAALTIESAPARAAAGETSSATTVMIEGACARGDGTFDWSAKIVFACTVRELPQLLAVLLGWHQRAEFRFHGGKAGKDLTLEHQDHGLFVRLRDGNAPAVAVPVLAADRCAWAMLVLAVMTDNQPGASASSVLAVCRDVMCAPAFLSPHATPR